MNIALINTSPKTTESASGIMLGDLQKLFTGEHNTKDFILHSHEVSDDMIDELRHFTVWVFAFPLYVDGVPSHLLRCLRQFEVAGHKDKGDGINGIHIYVIVNCGFYEGAQTKNALAIMENWCVRSGMEWGMGIGFGGGAPLSVMKSIPLGRGPKSALGKAFAMLKDAIVSQATRSNLYVSISYPKFLYKLTAEIGWWMLIKSNGGKARDLDRIRACNMD